MTGDSEAIRDGQQAWDRLMEWYRTCSSPRGIGFDGDSALTALTDTGRVRRLVDLIEFEAVLAARGRGKSWAEIAVRLGVTRQSAWERWRDIDDGVGTKPDDRGRLDKSEQPEPPESGPDQPSGYERTGTLRGRIRGRGAPDEPQPAEARERRRRGTVRVPNVVGSTRDAACAALNMAELRVISAEPDGLLIDQVGLPGTLVTDQSPEGGAKVPPGSTVRLWLARGDGPGGVREPRRPSPDPLATRQMRDEATDEAIG